MKKNATKDLKDFIYTELLIKHNGFTHISSWSDGYNMFPIPSKAIVIDTRSEVNEVVSNLKENSLVSKTKILEDLETKFEKSKRFIVYTGSESDLEASRSRKCPITLNNIKLYVVYLMNNNKIDKMVQFAQDFSIQDIIEEFHITDKELSDRILNTLDNPIEITETFPFLKV